MPLVNIIVFSYYMFYLINLKTGLNGKIRENCLKCYLMCNIKIVYLTLFKSGLIISTAQTSKNRSQSFNLMTSWNRFNDFNIRKGEGPIGLILAPTRELALQIFSEAKKYGKVYNISVVCAYGGGNKYEQGKSFEAGAEIAIATPGRMIDMIKMKVTNFERVTYLGETSLDFYPSAKIIFSLLLFNPLF